MPNAFVEMILKCQAGELLHLSIRQIQRLHNRYRNQGISGLVSQKRGQPSNRRYPDAEAELWTTRKDAAKRVYQPRYRRECFGELIQIVTW